MQANYGSPAAGALPHFLGVMFARAAGIDLRHVTYRGSAAALADLVAGQIPIVFTTVSDLVELNKAGRIRVLATSDRKRSPSLPEVPTFGNPATPCRPPAGTGCSRRPERRAMWSSA